jgi:hypothetical protein
MSREDDPDYTVPLVGQVDRISAETTCLVNSRPNFVVQSFENGLYNGLCLQAIPCSVHLQGRPRGRRWGGCAGMGGCG